MRHVPREVICRKVEAKRLQQTGTADSKSAFISADTVEAATRPMIRIRPPPANSISITPDGSEDGAGDGNDAGGNAPVSDVTTSELNVAGLAARSHSSCRQ